jgi:5'-3' exonuclease
VKLLLVDLSSLFRPIWEMSGAEADQDHASRATVGAVHTMAHGYDGVAICCDSRKSWRKELAPTYKANRPASQEPMLHQLRLAQEQLAKDGFPVWQAEGFEADDVIASAAARVLVNDLDNEVVIASSDKDLLQLVSDRVRVKSLRSGELYDAAGVKAKLGVDPYQVCDWLCLVGDSSDNVAGVKGIGKTRATELLHEYTSLFNLYNQLGDSCTVLGLTPSMFTNLKEGLHNVELARKLITLRTDVELPFGDIFKPRAPQNAEELAQEDTDMADVIDNESGEVMQTQEEPKKSEPPPAPPKSEPTNVVQMRPAGDEPKVQTASLAVVEWESELEPRSPSQVVTYANKLFNARIFDGYGTPEGVMTTILLGRELGLGMMGSLRGIHLADIRGKKKHLLSADLMAAMVLKSPQCKFFEPVELTPTHATYRTHRVGSAKPFEMTFNISEAKQAGLIKPGGGWETWPIDMCKARCVARLARTIYPDVCFGLYVAEEFEAA